MLINPRNVIVSIDDICDTPCSFSVTFYDADAKVVENQMIEWYQVTKSFENTGLTKIEAINKKNELIATLIHGTNADKLSKLTEYSAINGITVLPMEEQSPIYYEPYLTDVQPPNYYQPENNN